MGCSIQKQNKIQLGQINPPTKTKNQSTKMHFCIDHCIINPQILQPSCIINECAYVIFNEYGIKESRGLIIRNSLPKCAKIKLSEKTGISENLEGARSVDLSFCASVLTNILRTKYKQVIVVNYDLFYRALSNEYYTTRNIYIKKLIDQLKSIDVIDIADTEMKNPAFIAVTDCINIAKKIIEPV